MGKMELSSVYGWHVWVKVIRLFHEPQKPKSQGQVVLRFLPENSSRSSLGSQSFSTFPVF